MKRKLLVAIVMIAGLLAIPTAVFAHQQDVSTTVFYACEAPTASSDGTVKAGQIDGASITQDSSLTCPQNAKDYISVVQWSVTGPAGQDGTNGTDGTNGKDGAPGPAGPKGDKGDSGIPFSGTACQETSLTGSAQQENMVFCQSGLEADGGLVYNEAISAAKSRIMVGTPIAAFPSVDWSGAAITYVEFTSGLHIEYHSDNVMRVYNTLNQRIF